MNRFAWTAMSMVLVLVLAACGDSSEPESNGIETTTTAGPIDSGGDSGEPESSSTTTGASEDPLAALADGNGTASITVAGETVEFASFACYFGEDAVEAFDIDDLIFAALGRVEATGATVSVSTIDSPFGLNYSIFFAPNGGADMAWQRVGVDSTTVDGQRISSEGDFERFVNGETTGEYDVGTFDANCSS